MGRPIKLTRDLTARQVPQESADNRRADGTFGPGNRANPGGRPKGSLSLSAILREVLSSTPEGSDKTYARGIVEATVRDALKGDGQARRLCWAYIDGDPTRSVLVAGSGGGPIQLASVTEDQLHGYALEALAVVQEAEAELVPADTRQEPTGGQ